MPARFRDYYQTLEVPKSASTEEIKAAFRRLARKYHPDVATDKKAAEEKFKEINEAYEVLSDPEKRRKYDALGANWEQGAYPPPPPSGGSWREAASGMDFEFGGTGFSDFFEQLFGTRRTARGGWFSETMPERGQDIESDILVTLEEALKGSTRRISFRRSSSNKIETYTVRIPKGVREGQRIRLAGIGGPGEAGGAAGDLYLRVRYERHPDFEVEGADILHEAEVPVWKAVLGGEISVPTLEGRARLKIPPGSQSGQRLRLAGQGLPKSATERGDLYVVLVLTAPRPPLSPEQLRLWQQIAASEGAR